MAEWTEGLNETQTAFISDKKFENLGALVDAASKAPVTNWMDSVTSNQKGFLESKGFKDVGGLSDSYQNLEKLQGVPEAQLLKIPEKAFIDDPEGWGKVYDKLGRPEKAEGYEVTPIDANDAVEKKALDWAKGTFHKLGLTKRQGEGFIKEWNEMSATQQKTQQETQNTANYDLERALRTEWGMAYEKNRGTAVAAYKKLGVTDEMFAKLEGTLGGADAMKLFCAIGKATGEKPWIDGKAPDSGLMSPDQAKYELKKLEGSEAFRIKIGEGDVETVATRDKLIEMANPELMSG